MKIGPVKTNTIVTKKNPLISNQENSLKTQRFKKEVRLPRMPKDPKLAFEKSLLRNSAHHKNIGRSFERLKNPKAAIKAYENARYLDPKNISLTKVANRIKVNLITDLKA